VITFGVMALFHNRIPRHGDWLATGALGVCLALACGVAVQAWFSPSVLLANWNFEWLPMTMGSALQGGLMVDRLTAAMLVVVTLVSFLVHLFSTKYMEGDIRFGRYYCGLLLFTTSMLGLVLANNMLFLFVAWELVGLSSYLLIGHWYEKKSASDAAIKAFITTRVGDVGMFIGLMICYWKVGSLQYADIFAAVANGTLSGNWQTIAGLGIFLGAMGKSAQFPLHVWLPDAMEGPTPVSALIHAATMVAAGVYLVGRVLPIFDERTLLFIAYTGGITAIFSATIALVQDDIKKVLAYSTVSQLGYMIMALGVGGYVSGLFHLTTHAFFKAGLFLGSGAVIHAMHHEQSLSKYGGLAKKMPITAVCYLLATLALCGVPPFSGFWSKDQILGDALGFAMVTGKHWFLPVAGFTTAFLTAFYMFRQYFLTFTGKPRDSHAYDHAHEVKWQMWLPLAVLGSLALVSGGLGGWFGEKVPKLDGVAQVRLFQDAGYSSPMVEEALRNAPVVETSHLPEGHGGEDHEVVSGGGHGESPESMIHHAHQLAMKLSIVLAFSGIALGALMYYERRNGRSVLNPATLARRFSWVHKLLLNKYYFDELYWAVLIMPVRLLGVFMAFFDRRTIDAVVNFVGVFGRTAARVVDWADRLFVDGWFVTGLARGTQLTARGFRMRRRGGCGSTCSLRWWDWRFWEDCWRWSSESERRVVDSGIR
jgi:NADH-quinone oxidoreductase subunit L